MVNCTFFKDIEKRKASTNTALIEIIDNATTNINDKQCLLQAVNDSCKIYQMAGFFRGVNETIKIINKESDTDIEVYDVLKSGCSV